ncbi:TlpA family protein disulfide reductase [Pseudoxanthomonas spadix]|uniref:TlpA family protein disulfide reductase n=1 Tax=Pseudoxanthomonas spadix TaxID=415229 RepID=UPI000EFE77A1|nr:TlpA disulfide reductase family protein [Pseudoxanthomonas spadix]MBP3975294.1 TlpA family protein disulfide reductase [Pseudoxanthomonas spadix]RMW95684.1 TlpA family protein disulfide reductase [Pseudoxanthomonas spadix]
MPSPLRALSCIALLGGAGLLAACAGADGAAAMSQTPAATATNRSEPVPMPAAPDGKAPVALKLATVDGGTFDAVAHRGSWLVVNFWATWCHPCLAEMPELSQLDQRRADLGVLGLAYDDISPAELKAFLAAHPVSYPIAQVDVDDPPKAFEAPTGLPTTYLLDRQGRIAGRFVGPVTAHDIEQVVDGARDGRLP